ncbi:hypothetical protein Tco_0556944 [Tanacetum coccineum]
MEMMRYHFYNAHENKVSVARYAELFENSLKFTRSSGSLTLQKASGSIDYELEDHGEPANHLLTIRDALLDIGSNG